MTTAILLSFPIVAVIIAALVAKFIMKRSSSVRRSFKFNFATIGIMVMLFILFSFSVSADGGETASQAVEAAKAASSNVGIGLLAAGLCTGLAGIGGGIALAGGIPAAIGAVSEDPKAFGKALIFVALGETLALYGVVISVMILSKISSTL